MQTISSTALSLFKSGAKIDLAIDVEGLEGNLTLANADIVFGSLTIDRNCVSGANIEIGNVECSELTFNIDNFDRRFDSYRFEGAILTVDLIVGAEYIRLGKFIVDEIPRKLTVMTIKALDYMAKFDRAVNDPINSGTLVSILNLACTACGITAYTQSFLHSDYVAPAITDVSNLTWRNVIAFIAELAGCNAWMDWNGELRLTWYGDTQPAQLSPHVGLHPSVGLHPTSYPRITSAERRQDGYQMDENSITISGVVYRDGDTDLIAGTEDYAIVIEGNDLLNPADAETVILDIYNKIGGFNYTPYQFTTCALPHLWPGDMVAIVTGSGQSIRSCVMQHNYTLNGLSKLGAVGESVTRSGWASSGQFTAQQKNILKKLVNQYVNLTPYQQAVLNLNQLAANANGFYVTVVTDPITGATIYYQHDNPVLASSTLIYMMSEDGFFWTDLGWDGENTVWTSGYTATGNIVAKTLAVVGMSADWITLGGRIASLGNESWIDLADGTFSFANGSFTYNGDTIDVNGGTIGGWTIDGSQIYADNIHLDSSGFLATMGDGFASKYSNGLIEFYKQIDEDMTLCGSISAYTGGDDLGGPYVLIPNMGTHFGIYHDNGSAVNHFALRCMWPEGATGQYDAVIELQGDSITFNGGPLSPGNGVDGGCSYHCSYGGIENDIPLGGYDLHVVIQTAPMWLWLPETTRAGMIMKIYNQYSSSIDIKDYGLSTIYTLAAGAHIEMVSTTTGWIW